MFLVKNGDPYRSDHRPVIVLTESCPRERRLGGAGAFKFEAHWLKEEGCREVVKAAWNSGVDGGANLSSHLRGVASS